MTLKTMIAYAEKRGWTLKTEKNWKDMWVATNDKGWELTAVSLMAMKRMIDSNTAE